ncbi:MAG: C40 family peptidase [Rubrivivax sp.]|nr:C40 family peptidase [Rubrivivax sp.]MDP3615976.1 C40 family peptidase [Rubrivivax sp.]
MPLPPLPPNPTRLLLAALCAVFVGLSTSVHAEPAQTKEAPAETVPGDAVLQLLQDRGLLPTAQRLDDHMLVQQVRDTASDLVMQAMHFLGVPYRRGGNTAEQGFDCSGFTRHVFENSIGLMLPRRADQQAESSKLQAVKREQLRPGDLVFFNTMRRAFSHVGIYIGEGKFIHAPRTGGEVRVEDMRQAYWTKRFNGARRAELSALQTQQGVALPK